MSADPQAPGARLKAERERRGLSLQKAADEMRLDAWVIEALETDDYDRVGPAVYAKGHLKKYANLLTLPWDEILSGYESRRVAPVAPPPPPLRVATPTGGTSTAPRARIAGALLLLLIAAAVLWWKPWQQRAAVNATPVRPADASAAAALTASGAGSDPRADASGDADTGAGVPATGDAAPRDAPPSPATAGSLAAGTTAADNRAAMGAGVVRLRMSFSAESWVDVHDAAGHRVYSGYGQANSVKTLVGDGPLRVYLGFASGVQLEINERAVAIGSAFVHADVARFQAGADGVLRSFANDSRPQG